ncbi:MAG: carbohydrate ABC transporter permease [Lachnospiraceae bacterium]|nr:carbohydrate ABC transporter permease [Lachnospiraceae bacterium]
MSVKRAQKIRQRHTWDDILFEVITKLLLIFFVVIVAYPIYFIIVASFSDPVYANNGSILLFPKGFTLMGYERVFEDERIWIGYLNTIIYTVSGTALGTAVVLLAGYAFSRKDLPGSGILMKLFIFTMYFSGGMIPLFLVVNEMGLVNTRWSVILLGCVSVYNIIIVRSFMANTISDELMDAATIDGCGNGMFFFKIVLPLSKAVIAVMVLYIAVSYWNGYFNAMIFLTDTDKYPLQLFLRQILLMATQSGSDLNLIQQDPELADQLATSAQLVKYGMIVIATAPIICLYPFVQKYFVKGVMIGSVKG